MINIIFLTFVALNLFVYCHGQLEKRSDKFIVALSNKVNYITLEAELGTPPQKFNLLLDTGSSVTWVISKENPFCRDTKEISPLTLDNSTSLKSFLIPKGSISCEVSGTFDPLNSTTYRKIPNQAPFNLKYLDSITVSGELAHDVFKIPTLKDTDLLNLQTNDFEIGIGKETNSTIGIFGLGIPEFSFNRENNWIKYDKHNFVTKLKRDRIINRSVFSIFLNDRPEISQGGELLFGHIDEAKFQGPLYTFRFVNSIRKGDPIEKYEVPLTDILLNIPYELNDETEMESVRLFEEIKDLSNRYVPALLDTGSKFTYFPEILFDAFKEELISKYPVYGQVNDQLIIPCTDIDQTNDAQLGIKINDVVFQIPLRSFLERNPSNVTELLRYDQSKNLCLLGIIPTDLEFAILGQSFFRSVYTVFDLDMMEVSMAPAKYSNKRALREITIGNNVNGVRVDSVVEGGYEAVVLDPSKDFIEDTRDGFYKYHNNASCLSKEKFNFIFLSLVIALFLI